jgi:2,6-dihydroxypyridine 3-monooxygenase
MVTLNRTRERGTVEAMLRVVVVGGSLAGLTAAAVLGEAGCDVHVYERSASALTSRGAGIVVQPITVRYVLDHRIVELERISTAAGRLRYLNQDGSSAYEEPCTYRFTAWNTLYRMLSGCLDPSRHHLGEAMVGFDQDAGGVEVRFAGGRCERCHLLVCADGVSSTARTLLLPEVEARYAGYVAWRGTVRESELSPASFGALGEAITYHLMPHSHILSYPIPAPDGSVAKGDRLMNFVWYRNVAEGPELDELMTDRAGVRREVSLPPGAAQERFLRGLREDAATLPATLAEMVIKTPEPFVQPIIDVEVPRMAFGRACLIGDAAFVARPHAGAGTAKAAADAWALAEAMRTVDAPEVDVAGVLERWETGQLDLGRRLVARVRDMGSRSQFTGSWRPDDPSLRFGLYGPGR